MEEVADGVDPPGSADYIRAAASQAAYDAQARLDQARSPFDVVRYDDPLWVGFEAAEAARRLVSDDRPVIAVGADPAIWHMIGEGSPDAHRVWLARMRLICRLGRCIFGNPFRPVALDPGWRTEAVVGLATGIYADRAFARLPVLADALEDAGCANADVLGHCRGPGPHARGCWVVDLLLGKT